MGQRRHSKGFQTRFHFSFFNILKQEGGGYFSSLMFLFKTKVCFLTSRVTLGFLRSGISFLSIPNISPFKSLFLNFQKYFQPEVEWIEDDVSKFSKSD